MPESKDLNLMKIKSLVAVISTLMTFNCMAHQLNFEIASNNYTLEIESNAYNDELVIALPLDLVFEDYGSTERIAYLPKKLNILNSVSCTPKRLDITYYAPWGNIAVFTKDFRVSSGLHYIGNLSEELLEAIEQSGSNYVRITLKE